MKQIIPNLYTLTGLLAGRVYAIVDPDGVTIIDATIGGQAKRILGELAEIGRSATDVKRLLITHAHPDHIGSLPELKALTNAQVIVGDRDRAITEGTAAIDRPPREKQSALGKLMPSNPTFMKGTPVDQTLKGGETLPIFGGLQVVATPGHSWGHLTFWQAEKRVAIIGDVIMNMIGLTLPIAPFTVDMDEDKRSIRKVVDLEPSIVCFGHGHPVTENTPQKLRDFARKVGAL